MRKRKIARVNYYLLFVVSLEHHVAARCLEYAISRMVRANRNADHIRGTQPGACGADTDRFSQAAAGEPSAQTPLNINLCEAFHHLWLLLIAAAAEP